MPVLLDLVGRQGHGRLQHLDTLLRRQRDAQQPGNDDQEVGLRHDAHHAQEAGHAQHDPALDLMPGQHLVDDGVAGAGGAASAIAFALARAGVSRLTIANRTIAKAQQLIDRVAQIYPVLSMTAGSDDPSDHDLVVNATSLGLRLEDALPLDVSKLDARQLVAEIIMQPAKTPLLEAALKKGCQIHLGAPMLHCQIELMASFMRGNFARNGESA